MIVKKGLFRDDFGGPGGWSLGARMIGVQEDVGIETNEDACLVAAAAGFYRWQVDVTSDAVRLGVWGPIWLYVASPPCQTFSTAGKGEGRAHLASLIAAMCHVAAGMTPLAALTAVADEALDERTLLVLEPLLVIRDHRPANVAMEQVPGVLPIWEAYAEILRGWGYSVWTGKLTAEMFGVPQTRVRAILMASLERPVAAPPPTHSRYYSRDPQRLDPGVPKWVSMAETLGAAYEELSVRSNYGTGGDPADRGERTSAEPAFTVTEKVGRNKWMFQGNQVPGGRQRGDYHRRSVGAGASTITGEHRSAKWVPEFHDQSGTPFDPQWPWKRPATVVAGREIVQNPGATANRYNRSTKSRNDGVRVTVEEAGVLQSFPADYPWAAAPTLTSRYQRVGDAMPPLLAAHVLHALLVDNPTESN